MRQYLKEAREALGMTQTDVAQALGVSPNYYCDIENGERQKEIRVNTLISLSAILKISINEMLELERKFK